VKEVIAKSDPGRYRVMEYSWAFKNLLPLPARVLDVGGVTSYLTMALVKMGYEVYSIDIRSEGSERWDPWVHPDTKEAWRRKEGFVFIQEDIRKTTLPTDFFDQILCISTLEHVGLEAFDNAWIDVEKGDRAGLEQMVRIVEPGGSILVTAHYGDKDWRGWQHRVYDDARLNWLLRGFKVKKMEFATARENVGFVMCSQKEALENCTDTYGLRSLVLIEVTK